MEIKTLTPVKRQITLTVPAPKVNQVLDDLSAQYQSQTRRKGFRKGKVPLNSIESRFKAEIFDQAAKILYTQQARAAFKTAGLSPLNPIQVSEPGTLARGAELTFSFVVEVLPDLDLPVYKGIEITRKKARVTDAQVDDLVAECREELATFEPAAGRPEPGQVAEILYSAQGEFAPLFTSGEAPCQLPLGKNHFFEAFETMVLALTPGETAVQALDFPDNFHVQEMAGQKIDVEITLKALYRKVLPELDETFTMKVAKVASVEQMRDNLKQRQLAALEREYIQAAKKMLVDQLLEKGQVPLAPSLVRSHLDKAVAAHFKPLKAAGVPWEEAKKQLPALEKKQKPLAEKAARIQLMMMCIAQKETLTLSEEGLGKRIYQLAARQKKEVKDFVIQAQQSGQFSRIKKELMVEQVIDFLYQNARVTLTD